MHTKKKIVCVFLIFSKAVKEQYNMWNLNLFFSLMIIKKKIKKG